jgi:hypothetical protein
MLARTQQPQPRFTGELRTVRAYDAQQPSVAALDELLPVTVVSGVNTAAAPSGTFSRLYSSTSNTTASTSGTHRPTTTITAAASASTSSKAASAAVDSAGGGSEAVTAVHLSRMFNMFVQLLHDVMQVCVHFVHACIAYSKGVGALNADGAATDVYDISTASVVQRTNSVVDTTDDSDVCIEYDSQRQLLIRAMVRRRSSSVQLRMNRKLPTSVFWSRGNG